MSITSMCQGPVRRLDDSSCSWKRNDSRTSKGGEPMLRIISMARSGASPRFWTALVTASLAAAVFVTALAYAGSDGRKGTAGASELQIPVGARSTALGGTVVSDVTGIEAMF